MKNFRADTLLSHGGHKINMLNFKNDKMKKEDSPLIETKPMRRAIENLNKKGIKDAEITRRLGMSNRMFVGGVRKGEIKNTKKENVERFKEVFPSDYETAYYEIYPRENVLRGDKTVSGDVAKKIVEWLSLNIISAAPDYSDRVGRGGKEENEKSAAKLVDEWYRKTIGTGKSTLVSQRTKLHNGDDLKLRRSTLRLMASTNVNFRNFVLDILEKNQEVVTTQEQFKQLNDKLDVVIERSNKIDLLMEKAMIQEFILLLYEKAKFTDDKTELQEIESQINQYNQKLLEIKAKEILL